VSSGASLRRDPIEPPPSRFSMPDPGQAAPGDDLIAIGADLAPGTLLAAYRAGLFPMPVEPRRRRSKIAWYSPDPRGIIPVDGLHVTRSMRRSARHFETRVDTEFVEVMHHCGDPSRPGRWITSEIVDAYAELYSLGWAHSIEVWQAGRLVGGLYGVAIGGLFAGESMFHLETDASKVALMALIDWMRERDSVRHRPL
jgi:leucyl/phenylalanyl-tRNA---protein transferase